MADLFRARTSVIEFFVNTTRMDRYENIFYQDYVNIYLASLNFTIL